MNDPLVHDNPTAEDAAAQLERLRAEVREVRNWIGDNVPGGLGLTAVIKLEKALKKKPLTEGNANGHA